MDLNDEIYKSIKDLELIDQSKLDEAADLAKKHNQPLSKVLLEQDLIDDENLGKVTADILKLPFISFKRATISIDALKTIPEPIARKNRVLPFVINDKQIKIAVSNKDNLELVNNIAKKISLELVTYFATDREIENGLTLYDQDLQKTFDEILTKISGSEAEKKQTDAPIISLVDLLIERASRAKASDIHVEPAKSNSKVRFRIDGVLADVVTISKPIHEQIVSRIKVLARLRTDEHFSAQDGKLKANLSDEDLDVRVSIVPTTEGEGVVMRLLSSKSRQFGLSDLGMSEKDLQKVTNGYNKPYGMVLSTGPTGSGKTTTMYSILKIINTRARNIDTIEDPVEYEILGVNHIQVNPKTNLTFAEGLRSILRQDPDIIFVGEIRDRETAGIAVNAAMTGHLVLSTLHTNDAATSLPRLIDMDIEPFVVSSSINVIVAQRLVRKICEHCKVSQVISKGDLSSHLLASSVTKLVLSGEEVRVYKGKGCDVCQHTGYIGRLGIFEVLEISDPLKELINRKADANEIKNQAIKEGMTSMLDDGLNKVKQGLTSLEEVLRSVKE